MLRFTYVVVGVVVAVGAATTVFLKLYRERVTAEDCLFQGTLEIVSVASWDKDCGGLSGFIKLSNDKYCTSFGSRSLLRTLIAV